MSARSPLTALVALALFWTPLSLLSQTASPPPEVEEWVAEMQEIQMRLHPIEQRALQDPAVQGEQKALGAAVLAAMIEHDPDVEAKLDRLKAILEEAQAVKNNGDDARLAALVSEAEVLHPQLEQAQARAVALPEIQERMTSFREALYGKMAEIDPQARVLIARFQELERRVIAALG